MLIIPRGMKQLYQLYSELQGAESGINDTRTLVLGDWRRTERRLRDLSLSSLSLTAQEEIELLAGLIRLQQCLQETLTKLPHRSHGRYNLWSRL